MRILWLSSPCWVSGKALESAVYGPHHGEQAVGQFAFVGFR